MHEYLNTAGVHYFLACADCNVAHTGHHQLQEMTKNIYDRIDNTAHVFSMYTILFDNMADKFPIPGPPTITVDEDLRKFWQTELWLNYCVIMFLGTAEENGRFQSDGRAWTRLVQIQIHVCSQGHGHV